MKLLLATRHLSSLGGTETWTYTMAKYLNEMADVELFTIYPGLVSRKIEEDYGVKLVKSLMNDYDGAIINHQDTYQALIGLECPKVYTSHSAFVNLESFPDHHGYKKVCVTEEIQAKRGGKIIRNPIDMQRFGYVKPNDELKNVLFLAQDVRDTTTIDMVVDACAPYELRMVVGDKFDIESDMQWADVVITIGRGVLEAMSCGKNVISAGHRSWMPAFQGVGMIVDSSNMGYAFSGRDNPIRFTEDSFKAELAKYDPDRNFRPFIEEHYDAGKIARQYVELFHG